MLDNFLFFIKNPFVVFLIGCFTGFMLHEIKFNKTPIKDILDFLYDNFLIIFYIIVLFLVCLYCHRNWSEVTSFDPFNGNSILFIFMLILISIPFLESIKLGDNQAIFRTLRKINKTDARLLDIEEKLVDVSTIPENPNINTEKENNKKEIQKLKEKEGA